MSNLRKTAMSNLRKTVVYVAGPFRGRSYWTQEQNIRRAEALALESWRAGFSVICPHANTRFFQGELPDETWLEGDIEILSRCDALLTTPDWERSEGARWEVGYARIWGIRVFHSLGELVSYFSKE